jgi:hypothetical protein
MSKVRVLVGTRKGAFILTSDGKREQWEVDGPHFAGLEIYHATASPVDSDRIYVSQVSSWFDRTMAARRGSRSAMNSIMKGRLGRTSGTTARSTRGSLSASGTWSRR